MWIDRIKNLCRNSDVKIIVPEANKAKPDTEVMFSVSGTAYTVTRTPRYRVTQPKQRSAKKDLVETPMRILENLVVQYTANPDSDNMFAVNKYLHNNYVTYEYEGETYRIRSFIGKALQDRTFIVINSGSNAIYRTLEQIGELTSEIKAVELQDDISFRRV